MRHKYLYVNPRGFRNEFKVYRIRQDQVAEAERTLEQPFCDDSSHEWITRKEAERIVANERKIARENARAGIKSYTNPVGATEIEDWEES